MEDLMEKLQSILSTKEGQAQLNNIASMLNMNGNGNSNSNTTQEQTQSNQSNPPSQTGGFDLSSIANMLSGMNNSGNTNNTNNSTQSQPSTNEGGGADLSGLASMLSGLGNSSNTNQTQANPDSSIPNIDINMIMKLQQVFSSMNVNDKNSQLLKALKPHFSDTRQKKVDQAISMMRLMSMLPMLKESGIFSGL